MRVRVPAYVGKKLIGLNKKDFKVSTFRASGPGGQHRNKADTAIRITHKETGISAEATDSRSQATNKAEAFKKLVFKLIEHYTENSDERLMNNGWSEKIRTYHEPRDTVTDHRTGVTKRYSDVLDGDLDDFVEASIGADV